MSTKVIVIGLVFFSLCSAAMVADFSPMAVGNRWVYSDREIGYPYVHDQFRFIAIVSKSQNGDSVFYGVSDSTMRNYDSSLVSLSKPTYLDINDSFFVFDTLGKKWVVPTDNFFKFHQRPDSILTKGTFLNQIAYSYSINSNSCDSNLYGCAWEHKTWVQNYGLIYSLTGYKIGLNSGGNSSELKLLYFNGQPVDSFTTATLPKNIDAKNSAKKLASINNARGILRYSLSSACQVRLKYFDLKGRLAATILNKYQEPGNYTVHIKNILPAGGSYIRVFEAGSFTDYSMEMAVSK